MMIKLVCKLCENRLYIEDEYTKKRITKKRTNSLLFRSDRFLSLV